MVASIVGAVGLVARRGVGQLSLQYKKYEGQLQGQLIETYRLVRNSIAVFRFHRLLNNRRLNKGHIGLQMKGHWSTR